MSEILVFLIACSLNAVNNSFVRKNYFEINQNISEKFILELLQQASLIVRLVKSYARDYALCINKMSNNLLARSYLDTISFVLSLQ